MELKIITFYCLCDDFLISEGRHDYPQCTMSTAEVMTAAAFFLAAMKKAENFSISTDISLQCCQKVSLFTT